MNKLMWILFSVLCLLGCGDKALFHGNPAQKMTLSIHLVPASLLGTNGASLSAKKVAMITLDDVAELWGFVHVGDSMLSLAEADSTVIANSFWTLQGETYNGSKLTETFQRAGIDTVVFHVIDYLGDTLRDTLILYINTPLHISAIAPIDQQLDVPLATTNAIDFHWALSGVDSWETPIVSLQLVNDLSQINKANAVASTSGSTLHYPVSPGSCPADSQCRFWWRLTATVQSTQTLRPEDFDSTTIAMFQSRRTDMDSARMMINVKEVNGSDALGICVSAHHKGESTSIIWDYNPNTQQATSPLLTPGNWMVSIKDTLYPEFASESLSVTLGAGELRNLDELVELRDVLAPQAAPFRNSGTPYLINATDSLVFHVHDFGSGIELSSMKALWGLLSNTDATDTSITFRWTGSLPANQLAASIQILAKDISQNISANCSWILQKIASSPQEALLHGPFCTSAASGDQP